MKTLLSAVALTLITITAHAGNIGGGPHGGMSTGAMGPNGPGSTGAAMTGHASPGGTQGTQGSQGGRYSVVDGYQPWPQSEMRQYAKPRWEPYRGD
ncbi:hypothetical protein C7402_115209 [Paraburkholderia unamae]|uniref:PXPV repeat-containing protein n=1 Tax=Paraburkholderia unamae TaxID=219649 RepID=A0ABX5KLB6_9BURK|nr:hypothetical protein C7402_115209 [Paraburkholderia unamae]